MKETADTIQPPRPQIQLSVVFFCLVIFVVAYGVRLFYFSQLMNTPFFVPDFTNLDPSIYHQWAVRIAQGELLGKEVFTAMPLYAYFLGLLYYVSDNSVGYALLGQMACGAATAVLLFLLGLRVRGRMFGWISALSYVLYSVVMVYEGFLIGTALEVFLYTLFALLLFMAWEHPSKRLWFATGMIAGCAALSRASIVMITLILVVMYLCAGRPRRMHTRVVHMIFYGGMFLLILFPVCVRNSMVAHERVFITAHDGINFYIGNNPSARGTFTPPPHMIASSQDLLDGAKLYAEKEIGRTLSAREVSRYWYKKAYTFIRQEPIQWMRLLVRKCALFFNAQEIPDIISYEFMRDYIPILQAPWISFSLIAPLSLIGMMISLSEWRRMLPLYVMVGGYTLSIILYFVNARYRMPLTPVLLLFAVYGVWRWGEFLMRRRGLVCLSVALVGIGAWAGTHARLVSYDMSVAYNNLALMYKKQFQYDEAERLFQKAIQINQRKAVFYFNYANLCFDQRNYERAIELYREAIKREPEAAIFYTQLGYAYIEQKSYREAAQVWYTSLQLNPYQPELREHSKKLNDWLART